MSKRLLCLVSCMNTGGAETFLMKLYRSIDRDEYQMDFGVFVEEKCYYDNEIETMGGKIFHLTPKTKNIFMFKKELYDLIKNENYKYVLRITSNAVGFYDLKIAKEAGASVCIARSSNSSDGGGWKLNLINLIFRLLYQKYVDVKIAPSDLAAKYTFGKNAIKNNEIHYLNNALNLDVYSYSEESRKKVKEELGLKDKFVIGHIGRFSKQKNHEFLIDIFKEIKRKKDNAILLLVGNGELENLIKDKIKQYGLESSIVFTGVRSDIPALLSAMDIFVFPSFYEGMPNTVIEAQATGLPCFLSDTITKDAKITELVTYIDLKSNALHWSNIILNNSDRVFNRKAYSKLMREAGYDVNDVVRFFAKLIYCNN